MISIIIINWNSGVQLRACISSIIRYAHASVNHITVIDNGSEDGSDVGLEDFSNFTLIRANTNLGFGKACNLGAVNANGKYILFLNPDAAVYTSTLLRAEAFMEDPVNSRVGICGVQLQDEAGNISRSCARFPTVASFLANAVGLDKLLTNRGHLMKEWDHAENRQVDHVIGAFFMVRREVFEALQGFDEQFFLYLEDLDFSLRAHQAGWQSVYLADVQAFHAGGGTSKQIKARRLFYSLRSRMLYAFKHLSSPSALLVCCATLLVEPFTRSALAVCTGTLAGLRETWSAYMMLLRWLPRWIFKGETR
jgi:GT2 family glycosyltransferase